MLYLHFRVDSSFCTFRFQIWGSNLHLPSFVFKSFSSSNFRFLSFFIVCCVFFCLFFNVKKCKQCFNAKQLSFRITGSMLRRNRRVECFCQDESVLRIVSDTNNVNYEINFWNCRNYKNHMVMK